MKNTKFENGQIQDQVETQIADLDVEVELETADTSFTYTEPRAA